MLIELMVLLLVAPVGQDVPTTDENGIPLAWKNQQIKKSVELVLYADASFDLPEEIRQGLVNELERRIVEQFLYEEEARERIDNISESDNPISEIRSIYDESPLSPKSVLAWIVQWFPEEELTPEQTAGFLELWRRRDMKGLQLRDDAYFGRVLTRRLNSARNRELADGVTNLGKYDIHVDLTGGLDEQQLENPNPISVPTPSDEALIESMPVFPLEGEWLEAVSKEGATLRNQNFSDWRRLNERAWVVLKKNGMLADRIRSSTSKERCKQLLEGSPEKAYIEALFHECACRISGGSSLE